MRVLIQRVSWAKVEIEGKVSGEIEKGLLVFAGFVEDDNEQDLEWMANKLVNLRIFPDKNEVMNLSILDVGGDLLIVSQFTLHAKTKKVNRPSYILSAPPEISFPLYKKFVKKCEALINKPLATGVFGANMQVTLCNDGPVTIMIDSKNKDL